MKQQIDFIRMSLSIIAWCLCTITGLGAVAFYKWYGVQNDWLIGLTVSFVILTSLAFAILSFLSAVGTIRAAQASAEICEPT